MRHLTVLVLLAALSACPPPALTPDGGEDAGEMTGGGGGGGTTGGGTGTGGGGFITEVPPRYDAGTTGLATFCDDWATALCARDTTCEFLAPAQTATCLARAKSACAAFPRRVDAGVFTFDASAAARCLDLVGNRSCVQGRAFAGASLVFDLASDCPALFDGTGTANVPCELAADCASGFTCTATLSSCGACRALPAVGERCEPTSAPCHRAFCADEGDGGRTCVAWAPVGALCTLSAQCDPDTTRGCASMLDDAGVRTCEPKFPDGTACLGDTFCTSGFCNNAHLADAGPRRCGFIALGQACGLAGDCGPAAFCDGLTARTPGTCTARLALGSACRIQRSADRFDGCPEGSACFDGTCTRTNQDQLTGKQCRDGVLDCVRGTFCPSLPGDGGYAVCVTQYAAGTACTSSAQCRPGLRCTNNTCEPLAAPGERCFATQQCKDLLTCPLVDAGLGFFACTPLVAPGGSCTASGSTCASGPDLGEDGLCSRDGGRCVAPLSLDEPCTGGTECASGRCLTEDGGAVLPPATGLCQPACGP
ncbi:MAG TPA: Dickkopf N-terminal cysteine-rich domain-containing protein [Archangium sp.]